MTKNVNVKYDTKRTSPAVLLSALNSAGLQASLGKRETKSGTLPTPIQCQNPYLMISTRSRSDGANPSNTASKLTLMRFHDV